MREIDSQTVFLALLVILFLLLVFLEGILIRRSKRSGKHNSGSSAGSARSLPGDYTEVHCHILPGVDDGAPDMKTALALLCQEQEQGVRDVILTPHLRRKENDYRQIQKQFDKLQRTADEEGLDIRLYLGSELYYDSETVKSLRKGKAFPMAGSRYVLVEFAPGVHFSYISRAMNELMMAGYLPILAHVERYASVAGHLERVSALKEKGVYIQINANSFLKHPKRKELLALAQEGLVDFVGTDCHRLDWRPVCMERACRYLLPRLTREAYRRIFFENPRHIIEDRVI